MRPRTRAVVALAGALLLSVPAGPALAHDEGGDGRPEALTAEERAGAPECDPIDPAACMLPYPND
ncbi:hypothetical protein OG216_10015 [Streptomycetaceae bacterium NBC_01309]